jgi:hypothetical protein
LKFGFSESQFPIPGSPYKPFSHFFGPCPISVLHSFRVSALLRFDVVATTLATRKLPSMPLFQALQSLSAFLFVAES